MLIRTLKFLVISLVRLMNVTAIPLFVFAFRHSEWKGKEKQFVRTLVNDPDLVDFATRSGAAQMLVMFQQRVEQMMLVPPAPTEEERKWGEFIQNYGADPQPHKVPEFLEYIKASGTVGSTELPTLGALDALCFRHPELSDAWQVQFRDVFDDLSYKGSLAGQDRPGWNDYYMAAWFVTREDDYARKIAERTKLPGMVGYTCAWMANSVAQQIPAFQQALDRVGYEFPAPDMGGAVLHDAVKDDFKAVCNEFLQALAGATITRAEMTTLEGRNKDEDGEERIEVITSAGMLCIIAPDLGVSFTRQTERKREFAGGLPEFERQMRAEMEPAIPAGAPISIEFSPHGLQVPPPPADWPGWKRKDGPAC